MAESISHSMSIKGEGAICQCGSAMSLWCEADIYDRTKRAADIEIQRDNLKTDLAQALDKITELRGQLSYTEPTGLTIGEGESVKTNIRDSEQDRPVRIRREASRLVIVAVNEGGYNCTMVDLLDVLKWVKDNIPELWIEN